MSNVFACLGSIGYGTSDFLTKKLSKKYSVLEIIFWGQLLGVFPLLIVGLISNQLHITSMKDIIPAIFLGLLDLLTSFFLFRSLQKGKASIVMPISSSYVVVAVITSLILFHETLSSLKVLAIIATFIGLVLLSYEKYKQGERLTAGLTDALIAAFLMGLYFPIWSKFGHITNWLIIPVIVRLVISSASLGIIVCTQKNKFTKPEFNKLLPYGLTNSFAQIVTGFALHLTTQTSTSSVILSTSPVVTIFLAKIFLKEKTEIHQNIGSLLAISGAAILSS